MKPKFTPEQLARQERWRQEEQFSTASNVIAFLSLFPILHAFFPFLSLLAIGMSLADTGMRETRRKIMGEERKALDAQQKVILAEKDKILTQIEKLDAVKPGDIKHSEAYNINPDFGVKQRNMHLIKPSNILLNSISAQSTPSNIDIESTKTKKSGAYSIK
jgi:hypothetical protein